jgi:hypothetical protein
MHSSIPLATLLALQVATPPSGLRMLDAVYGTPERDRLCDATPPLARTCDGRADCVIVAGNALCGDPDVGTPKRLFIAFKCGDRPAQTLTIPEAASVMLHCQDAPVASSALRLPASAK